MLGALGLEGMKKTLWDVSFCMKFSGEGVYLPSMRHFLKNLNAGIEDLSAVQCM
jgi:hypothetical protein